ncbi:MAG: group II intron reverse transcriptase/maturase [Bacteroides sp.]|nr:group II intron reverse transcriptase/maturase [Bacteroides sp.]
MKGGKQKISQDTYLQNCRAEPEGFAGGQTFIWMTENKPTNANKPEYGLLEQILSPANLNRAFKRVRSNRGSGGVDKMEVESLKDYLVKNKDQLIQAILDGKYRPNPVRRVEIPKEKGTRKLGIPTVVDRVIQQAIAQVLSPIYEKQFSTSSYGFRPKRSAHQALNKCKSYITDGYKYAVDMDLEKFFDTVNQSKLIEVLARTVKDGRVISLIHKYLNAGVVIRNKFEETSMGVPQGGPLSPMLSNVMLNELDKELEKRGPPFVRYADDMVIFCKSKRSAERTLANIVPYIENKLFLRVNREKTKAAYVRRIKFLGYSFYVYKGEGKLRVHPRSIAKMKGRIKTLTSRSNGWGHARRKEALRQYITGWVNYFKLADMKALLLRVDKWYRRRLRMVIWKLWKRLRTRGRNLMKLGIVNYKAWEFANTRKGYWHTANSPILARSVTNDRLRLAGYTFFSDYYRLVNGIN